MSEPSRRWRPWIVFPVYCLICAGSLFYAVQYQSTKGWIIAGLAAAGAMVTGWQLVAVWRNWS